MASVGRDTGSWFVSVVGGQRRVSWELVCTTFGSLADFTDNGVFLTSHPMWTYPEIDPVLISIGPLAIRWYALSYLVGFAVVWWVLKQRIAATRKDWTSEALSDLLFIYGVLGVILGGRIGYMLFYGTDLLLADPLLILQPWKGGMSFHGGLMGVIVAAWIYARRHDRSFFEVIDLVAPAIPLALGCGRLGNFINAELPGRFADVPWALIYPGEIVARHPSSLYQFVLEGPVLFIALWLFSQRIRPPMVVSGAFLAGYGGLRFLTEFFREPDAHLQFVALGWVTMGQVLSLPMVLLGVGLMASGYRNSVWEPGGEAAGVDSRKHPSPKKRKSKKQSR